MNSTLVGPELETPPDLDRGGAGFADRGSGGGGRGEPDPARFDSYQTVVWVLMIPIVDGFHMVGFLPVVPAHYELYLKVERLP